jgi:hypothetical protein
MSFADSLQTVPEQPPLTQGFASLATPLAAGSAVVFGGASVGPDDVDGADVELQPKRPAAKARERRAVRIARAISAKGRVALAWWMSERSLGSSSG